MAAFPCRERGGCGPVWGPGLSDCARRTSVCGGHPARCPTLGGLEAGWEVTAKKKTKQQNKNKNKNNKIYTGRNICQIKYKFNPPPQSKHEQREARSESGRPPLSALRLALPPVGRRAGDVGGGRRLRVRADSGNRPLRLARPCHPVGVGVGGGELRRVDIRE